MLFKVLKAKSKKGWVSVCKVDCVCCKITKDHKVICVLILADTSTDLSASLWVLRKMGAA